MILTQSKTEGVLNMFYLMIAFPDGYAYKIETDIGFFFKPQ
jgi:hypothetical protein